MLGKKLEKLIASRAFHYINLHGGNRSQLQEVHYTLSTQGPKNLTRLTIRFRYFALS
jgi:creatinine amidohydrolase/Fe(II)-dependent formamide hydrolase-like protein